MKYNGTKVATAIFWVAVAFCVYLTFQSWGSWPKIIMIWILAPVSTLLLAFAVGAIFGLAGIHAIPEPEDEDADDQRITAIQAEILERSDVIGKYMDQPMYDWLKVRSSNGKEVTLTFVKVLPGEPSTDDLQDGGFALGNLLYRIKK